MKAFSVDSASPAPLPFQERIDKKALASFQKSPLAAFSKRDLQTALDLAAELEKSDGLVFVFAVGGMSSPSRLIPRLKKNVVFIRSLTEIRRSFAAPLSKAQMQKARFVFISKSGATFESLLFLQQIKKAFSAKKASLLKNQVWLLTESASSPLKQAVEDVKGRLIFWKNSLPGRFAFFYLPGLLQARLSGMDIKTFCRGFQKGAKGLPGWDKASLFLSKNRKFLVTDSSLSGAGLWMERAFSESLAKAGDFYPLRVLNFQDMIHSFLEEAQSAFVLYVTGSPPAADLSLYERARVHALKEALRKKSAELFVWRLTDKRDCMLGGFLAFCFFCIHFAGEKTGADIYRQPAVDSFKSRLNILGQDFGILS